MKTAIQMYSLREYIKNDGLDAILEKVKNAGFDGVETAGLYGLSAHEFKSRLDEFNLKVSSMHIGCDEILNGGIETAKILEAGTLVIPWMSFSQLTLEKEQQIAKLKKVHKACTEANLNLAYHNHANEYYCGKDYVLEFASAVKGLKVELDIFWLAVGGKSLRDYHKTHKNNYFTFHIKELSTNGPEDASPIAGQGCSDSVFARELAKKYNFEWLILEFEKINIPYEEYLSRSVEFLKG